MTTKDRISVLRKLNKHFMNNANKYLNTAFEQLNCERPNIKYPTKIDSDDNLNMSNVNPATASGSNQFNLKPVKRQQYDNWKKRNDSQSINSRLVNSTKSDRSYFDNKQPSSLNRSYNSCINLSSKTYLQSAPTPKKLLVSNKLYNRSNRRNLSSEAPLSNSFNNLLSKNSYRYKSPSNFYSSKDYISHNDIYSEVYDNCNESILSNIDSSDLESLKNFRDKYYFECHSIRRKLNEDISIKDHRCRHEFVLNDRLFLEPVYKDHQNNSRCKSCHLPLHLHDSFDGKSNKMHLCGLIDDNEDKFKSLSSSLESLSLADSNLNSDCGNKTPEVVIKFPYRNDFVIPQWKIDKNGPKSVSGNSDFYNSFKKSLHSYDSMALKYRKGYKKH